MIEKNRSRPSDKILQLHHCEKELSHFSGLHQCHCLTRNKEKDIIALEMGC
jgi:hypothetical protein